MGNDHCPGATSNTERKTFQRRLSRASFPSVFLLVNCTKASLLSISTNYLGEISALQAFKVFKPR